MGKNALIIVDPQLYFVQDERYSIAPFADRVINYIEAISKKFNFCLVTKKLADSSDENEKIHPKIADIRGIMTFSKESNVNKLYDSSFDSFGPENISLIDFLNKNGVDDIFVVGPIDSTVNKTSVDLSKNFNTHVILDCVKYAEGMQDSLNYLVNNNINILNSSDIKYFLK